VLVQELLGLAHRGIVKVEMVSVREWFVSASVESKKVERSLRRTCSFGLGVSAKAVASALRQRLGHSKENIPWVQDAYDSDQTAPARSKSRRRERKWLVILLLRTYVLRVGSKYRNAAGRTPMQRSRIKCPPNRTAVASI
jgi:hypothetical protein